MHRRMPISPDDNDVLEESIIFTRTLQSAWSGGGTGGWEPERSAALAGREGLREFSAATSNGQ